MLKEHSKFSTQRTIELLKNLTRNMILNSSDSPCDPKEPEIPPLHCDKEWEKMNLQNMLFIAKNPSPEAHNDNLVADQTLLSLMASSTASKITRPVGDAVEKANMGEYPRPAMGEYSRATNLTEKNVPGLQNLIEKNVPGLPRFFKSECSEVSRPITEG